MNRILIWISREFRRRRSRRNTGTPGNKTKLPDGLGHGIDFTTLDSNWRENVLVESWWGTVTQIIMSNTVHACGFSTIVHNMLSQWRGWCWVSRPTIVSSCRSQQLVANIYNNKKGIKVYEKHLEVEIEEGNNYFCVYLEYSNFRVINCDTFRIIYCYTC